MASMSNKVVHVHYKDEQAALERLNRITGQQFSTWPQSLMPVGSSREPSSGLSRVESMFEQALQRSTVQA